MGHLHALWNDLWPNTVAPSAWTLAAVGVSHWRTARRQRRHHEELRQHVTAAVASGIESEAK